MLEILVSVSSVSSLYVVSAFHISLLFLFLGLFWNVPYCAKPALFLLTQSKA